MILTAVAVTFGLSVVLFLAVALSAPMLDDDGTLETLSQQSLPTDERPAL